ncbi:MAG: hypothetical protein ACLP3C_36330 [Mycobacterium sp.]|uniref:hypothetical protein n=1 Tax=Mycobacterium sp. TaxID=1785 RepID=UPI003F9A797A
MPRKATVRTRALRKCGMATGPAPPRHLRRHQTPRPATGPRLPANRPPHHAVRARQHIYRHWVDETQDQATERQRWIDQHFHRSQDQGLEYGIDL